jgi:hypothetical protein
MKNKIDKIKHKLCRQSEIKVTEISEKESQPERELSASKVSQISQRTVLGSRGSYGSRVRALSNICALSEKDENEGINFLAYKNFKRETSSR